MGAPRSGAVGVGSAVPEGGSWVAGPGRSPAAAAAGADGPAARTGAPGSVPPGSSSPPPGGSGRDGGGGAVAAPAPPGRGVGAGRAALAGMARLPPGCVPGSTDAGPAPGARSTGRRGGDRLRDRRWSPALWDRAAPAPWPLGRSPPPVWAGAPPPLVHGRAPARRCAEVAGVGSVVTRCQSSTISNGRRTMEQSWREGTAAGSSLGPGPGRDGRRSWTGPGRRPGCGGWTGRSMTTASTVLAGSADQGLDGQELGDPAGTVEQRSKGETQARGHGQQHDMAGHLSGTYLRRRLR